MKFTARLVSLCLAFVLPLACLAAEGGGDDAKMRAMLRDLTQQLRIAQSDLAAAQGTQATLTADNKVLTEKYETVRKQAAGDRVAADQTATGLKTQVVELKTQVDKLTADLAVARADGQKVSATAQAAETERTRLAGELVELQQRLADREAKNLALFLLGNEILRRYEDFSLGNALRAKEPFIGLTRTKLENLVQDYEDKLRAERVGN